ncbi:hypothetical protein G7Z17_g7237 [Cylindrodendrum hubeiense]|uniref:Xylanolytic transcriptional activator regulatory domain-containing protein n=1 Tax=Cylindrodendrum hubeiense TaxID=595255 RepID=A0A9P5H418_9HYPO|nr:hypothetical protein G7Z17_g7237 [Cylindrodendrum hubeiense]
MSNTHHDEQDKDGADSSPSNLHVPVACSSTPSAQASLTSSTDTTCPRPSEETAGFDISDGQKFLNELTSVESSNYLDIMETGDWQAWFPDDCGHYFEITASNHSPDFLDPNFADLSHPHTHHRNPGQQNQLPKNYDLSSAMIMNESIALFHSMLAIGSHSLNLRQDSPLAGTAKYPVLRFFDEALSMRQHFRDNPSIPGLQALLAMAHFSSQSGADSTSGLLADAALCIQTLRLHSNGDIEKWYLNQVERENARRAFWFFYSLEKPHCLYNGLFPLIHDDFIDHDSPALPSPFFGGIDWLSINTDYATLCSFILRQGCKHSATSTVKRLENMLDDWEKRLPFGCSVNPTQLSRAPSDYSALTLQERRLRVKSLYRYCFATIAIHCMQDETVQSREDADRGKEKCYAAAQDMLKTSYHISSADVVYDR